MKDFAEIKKNPRIAIDSEDSEGMRGIIGMPRWSGSVIASTGAGWDHVSVAPFQRRIVPTWEDMCLIKDIFFEEDEAVIQIHPPKAEYVNNVPNCLHLWKCTYKEMTLPPSILVGVKKGMSMQQIKKEIQVAYEIAGEKS